LNQGHRSCGNFSMGSAMQCHPQREVSLLLSPKNGASPCYGAMCAEIPDWVQHSSMPEHGTASLPLGTFWLSSASPVVLLGMDVAHLQARTCHGGWCSSWLMWNPITEGIFNVSHVQSGYLSSTSVPSEVDYHAQSPPYMFPISLLEENTAQSD